MKVYIGPQELPLTAAALQEAGAQIVDSLAEAEGYVATMWPGQPFPELSDQVRWVQLPMAGIDGLIAAGVIDDKRRWANASGIYAKPVAESALALLLALIHQHPRMVREKTWAIRDELDLSTRWLFGQKIMIIGMGGIGELLTDMLAAFDAQVIAVTRTGQVKKEQPNICQVVPFAELDQVLGEADHVILACPLTPDTEQLINAERLRLMKNSAVLVNIARGPVVDTEALVAALAAGEIAGAGLDVTEPEPLPDDHPLWRDEKVLITPHTANSTKNVDPLLAPVAAENYRRFLAGEKMVTEVTVAKGY